VAEHEERGGWARFGGWLADNGVLYTVAAGAYGGSLSHWLHLAEEYGQGGLTAWFIAACVDLLAFEAARERAHDAKIGRERKGAVSFPAAVLAFSAIMTLAGNAFTAEHKAGGILLALIPGVVLLISLAFMERRAAESLRRAKKAKAERERQEAEADRQSERQAEREERQRRLAERHASLVVPPSATVTHLPASATPASETVTHLPAGGGQMALPAGPLEPAPANATGVMRAYWDREVAAGRIPSGADLLRAAGLSSTSSLGRQNAAKWKQELDQAREPGGGARSEVSA
jgi:hypothetical protein